MPEGQAHDEDFSPEWPSSYPHAHVNHCIILASASNSMEAKLSTWFRIFNYGQYILLTKWRPATHVVRSFTNAAPFHGRNSFIHVTGFQQGEKKWKWLQCSAWQSLSSRCPSASQRWEHGHQYSLFLSLLCLPSSCLSWPRQTTALFDKEQWPLKI